LNRYKGAKRDNDSVYFEKVPTLSSLPAIQGAILAKPQPFDCHDPEVCGADIFQKLVPLVMMKFNEFLKMKFHFLGCTFSSIGI
jgi:hypothetical protein